MKHYLAPEHGSLIQEGAIGARLVLGGSLLTGSPPHTAVPAQLKDNPGTGASATTEIKVT